MKKILIAGITILLVSTSIKIIFSKKENNEINNINPQIEEIENDININLEDSEDTSEDINEIEEVNDSENDESLNDVELSAVYYGFADSNSIEVYSNGQYEVIRISESAAKELDNIEVGDNITLIYSDESGTKTITGIK